MTEEGCPPETPTVTWVVSEAPRNTSKLIVDQPPCTTLLVTSGSVRAHSGFACGNESRQVCAFLNRTGPQPQRVELAVDVDHVWMGVATASAARTLADKSTAMLAAPNCGDGCGWATVGGHKDGRLESELLVRPDGAIAGTARTELFVDARDQTGIAAFVAPKSGTYEFRVACGSYTTVPTDGPERFYRSVILGYFGSAPLVRWTTRWGHPEPGLADLELGVWETTHTRSKEAIERATLGLRGTKFMNAGDRAIFTAVDEQGTPYADNRGGVCLAISYIGSV